MLPLISDLWNDVYHHNLMTVVQSPEWEMVNHTFEVEYPTQRSVRNPVRNFNEGFGDLMYEWMMQGGITVSDRMIELNPNARNYNTIFAPTGRAFNCTAYGPRVREQLPHVLDILAMTKGVTRRAEIMILGPQDIHVGIARETGETTCEYPCTMGFNFRVRNGKLDMVTTMRSNNYTTTVNQDFYVFTKLQEHIANMLNVECGRYYHSAQSAHVFWHDAERVFEILRYYIQSQVPKGEMHAAWRTALKNANDVYAAHLEARDNG